MNPFKTGDSVICIDADRCAWELELNKIYTINSTYDIGATAYINIVEISKQSYLLANRFKLVETPMTPNEKLIQFLKDNPECGEKLAAHFTPNPEPVVWANPDRLQREFWALNDSGTSAYETSGNQATSNGAYPTKEIALAMRDWNRVQDKMRIAANLYQYQPGNNNFCILADETLIVQYYSHTHHPEITYFKTRELAQAFIDSLSHDGVVVLLAGRPVY